MYKKIIFWEPTISPHKIHFFAEIANILPEVEIICIAHENLSKNRLDQGWEVGNEPAIQVIVKPDLCELDKIVISFGKSDVMHVFSGWRWFSTLEEGISIIKRHGLIFSIMSEPRNYEGIGGVARYIQSSITEGWIRSGSGAKHIFAIGANGRKWFKMVGYDDKKIIPFGYFVNKPIYDEVNIPSGDKLIIGYLGRLVDMKGVGDIISACALVKDEVYLRIAGHGDMKKKYMEQANRYALQNEFYDPIPMPKVGEFLRGLDVLVLPSRSVDDGWGVVVSEALMCGTPVVVSSRVGASLAVINSTFGRVVPAGSPRMISEAICDIGSISRDIVYRENIACVATNKLSAKAGAKYFIDILNGEYNDGKRYFA